MEEYIGVVRNGMREKAIGVIGDGLDVARLDGEKGVVRVLEVFEDVPGIAIVIQCEEGGEEKSCGDKDDGEMNREFCLIFHC